MRFILFSLIGYCWPLMPRKAKLWYLKNDHAYDYRCSECNGKCCK